MSSVSNPSRPLQRSVLALALRSVLLAGVSSVSLASALAQAEQAATRHYALAAGPLEDSLNGFAQAAGISLPFDPALVQGKRAPALRGDYAVQDGLDRLLVGSGLAVTRTASGNYLLIARGAKLDARAPNLSTPLMMAVPQSGPIISKPFSWASCFSASSSSIDTLSEKSMTLRLFCSA